VAYIFLGNTLERRGQVDYQEFIKQKHKRIADVGFDVPKEHLHPKLFDFQAHIVPWALKLGRAAVFAECGLGKTMMQINWADAVHRHTGGKVLILTPLSVSEQTIREADRFGFSVVRKGGPIDITNYERLHHYDPSEYVGVVLDESSILKNFTGKVRNQIIDSFKGTRFKLACTATPAPNDYMELGNHSEFLGVKSRTEMLAEYFVHDGGETQVWRLKGHAISEFWNWVRQWAIICAKPSDLGYSDAAFELPNLTVERKIVQSNYEAQGTLFPMMASTLTERRTARRSSIDDRVELVSSIVAKEPDRPWIIWCNLNDEADALAKAIPDAVEIRGSHTPEQKNKAAEWFCEPPMGRKILISKSSIFGFGLNFQHCARMVFCGLSDSFEEYYQAIRRAWRFGQTEEVKVYIVTSAAEQNVVKNVLRKQEDFLRMQAAGASYGTSV
jgi:hypothetical protein